MLQDVRPGDDLLEFIRKCCPIAYKAVGKVVSAYGGLRCTPAYALVYPAWAKSQATVVGSWMIPKAAYASLDITMLEMQLMQVS